jgi:hypothetical protein
MQAQQHAAKAVPDQSPPFQSYFASPPPHRQPISSKRDVRQNVLHGALSAAAASLSNAAAMQHRGRVESHIQGAHNVRVERAHYSRAISVSSVSSLSVSTAFHPHTSLIGEDVYLGGGSAATSEQRHHARTGRRYIHAPRCVAVIATNAVVAVGYVPADSSVGYGHNASEASSDQSIADPAAEFIENQVRACVVAMRSSTAGRDRGNSGAECRGGRWATSIAAFAACNARCKQSP